MEETFKKLAQFSKLMGVNNFYSIEANSSGVSLQGEFSLPIVRKARKMGFVGEVTKYGYVRMCRGEYSITLT
jgi:hypothetical protein